MDDRSIEISGRELGLPMVRRVSHVRSHFATRNPWHCHPGFELIFLLEGATGYEFRDHEGGELHGGHFLVIPPQTVHRGWHDLRAPCTLCGVTLSDTPPRAWRNTPFTLADRRGMLAALRRAGSQVHAMDPSLRWLVRRLMTEIVGFSEACAPGFVSCWRKPCAKCSRHRSRQTDS